MGGRPRWLGFVLCVALGACDFGVEAGDVGDEGVDAGLIVDAGPTVDAGPIDSGPPLDAGPAPDAGLPLDSGPRDAGPLDAGPLDAGPRDAGPLDSGPVDSGPVDSGPVDSGPADSGPRDSGPADSGPRDAGCPGFLTLDFPGASHTHGDGVNSAGDVVGSYDNGHGFLFRDGVFSAIQKAGARETWPMAIDDLGVIAGSYVDSSGGHGFLLVDGTFSNVGYSVLNDRNANGAIVGSMNQRGYLLDGNTLSIIDYPGKAVTGATGINLAVDIVGYAHNVGSGGLVTDSHGFLLRGGVFTPLAVPGATSTSALGISDSGVVVGVHRSNSGYSQGFIYSAGAYSTLSVPGGYSTVATGISAEGHIVGSYDHGLTTSAFLYTPPDSCSD